MPVNCCKSGRDQDLLRSLWDRGCWKLLLYFFGDIRLISEKNEVLQPRLWSLHQCLSPAASLHIVLGLFLEVYSARDHPAGRVTVEVDKY